MSIRKSNDQRVRVTRITPAAAGALLSLNTRNRAVRRAVVDRYARDMTSDRWLFNGDSIRVAADGTILDGQHRLRAVVQSGVTIETILVRDLPEESQQTMDTGARRNLRDQLVIGGVPHARELAPILRLATQMRLGSLNLSPSEMEQQQMLRDHPELHAVAEFASAARRRLPVQAGAIGAAYWTCWQVSDLDAVTEFFDPVLSGAGLSAGDPRLALRNKFIEPRGDRRNLTPSDIYGYTIRAWNAWREGRTLHKLQAPKTATTSNGRVAVGFTKSNLPAAI